jgi:dipeptidase E
MKLFLSSMAISEEQGAAFTKLVGKAPKDIKLALIENAADVYRDDSKDWVDANRKAIQSRGYQIELIDLRTYQSNPKALKDKLSGKDAIWLGGGNIFYLRWILKDTGADTIIKELTGNGVVYGGGSAGATVAGPTLKYFKAADDPNDAPEVILEGLSLTEIVVVPHVGNEKYGEMMEKINKLLKKDGYTTETITDQQAIIINGKYHQIIP